MSYPRDNGASIVIRMDEDTYEMHAHRVRSAKQLQPTGRWGLVRIGRRSGQDSYTVEDGDIGARATVDAWIERIYEHPTWLNHGEHAVDYVACPEVAL